MKIIKTADGSNTIYVESLNEQYHSINGAVTESLHVFIKYGLEYKLNSLDSLSILEMGFGTGLNALLTFLNKNNKAIDYTSVEKFPVNNELLKQLNYETIDSEAKESFLKLHSVEWNKKNLIGENFTFSKIKDDWINFESSKRYDIIYYDAFAPQIQPELWTFEIFNKCYELLNDDGCLVTYCAKGQVKRNMKLAGFKIEGLPGPPGKREMTRAIKTSK